MENKNFIKRIKIENFKSIENLKLEANKINIFIGEPNVGKSNFLEALGFLSALGHQNTLREYIRLKHIKNLFHKESLERELKVIVEFNDDAKFKIKMNYDDENHYRLWVNNEIKGYLSDHRREQIADFKDKQLMYGKSGFNKNFRFYEEFNILKSDVNLRRFMYYKFRDFHPKNYEIPEPYFDDLDSREEERELRQVEYNNSLKMIKTLIPPLGKNIYHVLKNTESSKNAVRDLLSEFNLKLFFRQNPDVIEIVKEEDGIFFSLPLYSLADTIQSVIFYNVAILSNNNNILIFEEPEAHTFPFYTSRIGELIAKDTKNQYFIATHNPYFLDSIYSKARSKDLQINLVRIENNKTVIHQLSKSDLDILFDDDVFSSLSHFDDWPR